MILALVLLIALLWGITYLITDILYTVLDPRIRIGGAVAGGADDDGRPLMPRPIAASRETTPARQEGRTNFQLASAALLAAEAGRGRTGASSSVPVPVALFAPLIAPTSYDEANLLNANSSRAGSTRLAPIRSATTCSVG